MRKKEERANIIKEISKRKYDEFVARNLGTVHEIHVEKRPQKATGLLKGVSENYLTIVTDSKDLSLTNTLQQVKITGVKDGQIYGELSV